MSRLQSTETIKVDEVESEVMTENWIWTNNITFVMSIAREIDRKGSRLNLGKFPRAVLFVIVHPLWDSGQNGFVELTDGKSGRDLIPL